MNTLTDIHLLDTDLIYTVATHLVGMTSFKKAYGSVVSNRMGMKLRRIVFEINMHQLAESRFLK